MFDVETDELYAVVKTESDPVDVVEMNREHQVETEAHFSLLVGFSNS